MDFPFSSNVKDLSESTDTDSAQENELCSSVLRYINQVLMEDDDSENKHFMIQDSTVDAAAKSLSEILNQKCPSFPNQHLPHEDTSSSSDDSITNSFSNCTNSLINAYNSAESARISNLHKYNPFNGNFQTNPKSFFPPTFCDTVPDLVIGDGGILDVEKNRLTLQLRKSKERNLEVVEKDEGDFQESLVRGRESLHREESDLEDEMRSNKHFADCPHESVLSEMFAKVSMSYDGNEANGENMESQQNESAKGSNVKFAYTRKGATKREAVDMRSLLIQCMESVANNDHRRANSLLKQIRSRSSPSGDGSQRLAYYFFNSLKARLLGTGSLTKVLSAISLSNADVLKAHKLGLSSFPFMETSYFFSAQSIMDLAQNADAIHIIHFGIVYGLQWPPLIQQLSTRPGGPPKLRITGIDLPVVGFWPGSRMKETGRRLANYCKRFSVPFQFNGFEQNWETVSVEDLGIEKGEVLIVNCAFQLMYLLDDTLMEHSPRDAVLSLFRRINPDMFIHSIVNAAYNSPFFISRFREALFHYSALFDMFEANVPRENEERMLFEREIWGNEILCIIACEGLERVRRPETYKRWQIRTQRAGFRQLPLSQGIMKTVKAKVKNCYHKDFFVDEASNWLLEGWRGRVLYALSCWKPT
ncbi:scarecrow-like protein 14 [Rhododendron vialii]|uniref:scarecrow-like protein 14 n=1 Tax=Rhododendron vialii TaxID=182163 RepID=UPI00265F172C|nr:scarecrow-like protein 14 [Rhododendron vialii]XP_058199514.1 scarecrow-like protein 14 [Rhododendron vialii]